MVGWFERGGGGRGQKRIVFTATLLVLNYPVLLILTQVPLGAAKVISVHSNCTCLEKPWTSGFTEVPLLRECRFGWFERERKGGREGVAK